MTDMHVYLNYWRYNNHWTQLIAKCCFRTAYSRSECICRWMRMHLARPGWNRAVHSYLPPSCRLDNRAHIQHPICTYNKQSYKASWFEERQMEVYSLDPCVRFDPSLSDHCSSNETSHLFTMVFHIPSMLWYTNGWRTIPQSVMLIGGPSQVRRAYLTMQETCMAVKEGRVDGIHRRMR